MDHGAAAGAQSFGAPHTNRDLFLRELLLPNFPAGREDAALAFDVDIVKVGRGWGDEVNALYPSANRGVHRRRHRVRLAGAAAAEKQPAP